MMHKLVTCLLIIAVALLAVGCASSSNDNQSTIRATVANLIEAKARYCNTTSAETQQAARALIDQYLPVNYPDSSICSDRFVADLIDHLLGDPHGQ